MSPWGENPLRDTHRAVKNNARGSCGVERNGCGENSGTNRCISCRTVRTVRTRPGPGQNARMPSDRDRNSAHGYSITMRPLSKQLSPSTDGNFCALAVLKLHARLIPPNRSPKPKPNPYPHPDAIPLAAHDDMWASWPPTWNFRSGDYSCAPFWMQ